MALVDAPVRTETAGGPSPTAVVAGALLAGAGLVHAAAAGTHQGDTTMVVLFAVAALVQVGGGGLVASGRAGRHVVQVVVVANLGLVAVWLVTRMTGLPVVDALASAEVVGRQDLVAACLGAAGAALALASLQPTVTSPRNARFAPVLGLAALVPAVFGMVAPHAHGDGHGHGDDATEVAHGHDDDGSIDAAHGHDGDAATDAAHDGADGHHGTDDGAVGVAFLDGANVDPMLAGADVASASDAQIDTALGLIADTRVAVEATGIATEADAAAAGFVWIGDGGRVGGFRHHVHPARMVDGIDLDPAVIESLVFRTTADGSELVSAMYILGIGQTMADAPLLAADLTPWHDHQDLCWADGGLRLAGVAVDGVCAAGTLRPTPPMLHVWLVPHDCGPFAGVESHGGGACTHDHG